MEIYGHGFRIAKYDEGVSDPDRKILEEAISNIKILEKQYT